MFWASSKGRCGIITLVFAFVVLLIPARAFAGSLLQSMPTVAQVEAKVHGSDPIDTAARQSMACRVLRGIFIETTPGGFGGGLDEADRKRMDEYTQAESLLARKSTVTALKRYRKHDQRDDPRASSDYHDEVVELFGLQSAIDVAETQSRAAQAVATGSVTPPLTELLPYLGILALGVVMVLAALFGMAGVRRKNRSIRKEAFERRNAHGVLEFRTFEEAEAFRNRKPNSDMEGCSLVVALLAGLFLVLVGGGVLYLKFPGFKF